MIDTSNINKEVQELGEMFNFFTNTDNYNRLPILLQIKYVEALIQFAEAVKPLYISALSLGIIPADGGDSKEN